MSEGDAILSSSITFANTSSLNTAMFFGMLTPNMMLFFFNSAKDICVFLPILIHSPNFLVSMNSCHLHGPM